MFAVKILRVNQAQQKQMPCLPPNFEISRPYWEKYVLSDSLGPQEHLSTA
jgi:hypothetical protein